MMDFERIQLLLAVATASLDYPQLRNIHNAALEELKLHNDDTASAPPSIEPDSAPPEPVDLDRTPEEIESDEPTPRIRRTL